MREAVVGLLRCCCGSVLGRVHVEKEVAAAVDEGASIAGGKRLTKALAGHSALRVSIVDVSWTTVGRRREVAVVPRTFHFDVSSCRLRALAIAEKRPALSSPN